MLSAPFDGERRLISLITASSPADTAARSDPAKPRTGAHCDACSISASMGR